MLNEKQERWVVKQRMIIRSMFESGWRAKDVVIVVGIMMKYAKQNPDVRSLLFDELEQFDK